MMNNHRALTMPIRRALAFWLLLIAATSAVQGLELPLLAGRINDQANLLSPVTKTRLETRLEELERSTGAQVVVLTLPSLDGEALEDVTLQAAQNWGLGRKDIDDGVLVLVARDDREIRIEVGYGLESLLTDARSGQIIDQLMKPRFRDGDFDGGIAAALNAIAGIIRKEPGAIPESPPPSKNSFLTAAAHSTGVIAETLLWSALLLPFAVLALILRIKDQRSDLFRYLAAFQDQQGALSSALSRLLVVVERYPDLKATESFRDLQHQLEGAENRIAVERRRFNEAARVYNTSRRRFPAVLIASWLGFDEAAYFQSEPGAEQPPEVDFSRNSESTSG